MSEGASAGINERVTLRKYDVLPDGTQRLVETITIEHENGVLKSRTDTRHSEEEGPSCH